MKTSGIIRRSVVGALITAVAVCAFGCSDTTTETSISSESPISNVNLGAAFSSAADEYGIEKVDWDALMEHPIPERVGLSSIESDGDDADEIFYSNVAAPLGIPPADAPEISEISVFYVGEPDELIYGHYIVFENEEDCQECRDIFYDWFGDEVGEEMGFESFFRLSESRMNALYMEGNTIIWITGYLYDTPEMLPYIYDQLGLNFPEMSD